MRHSWWRPVLPHLLLNSQSLLFPDGLANSSGAVGRYLTDSVGHVAGGVFRSWRRCQPTNRCVPAACAWPSPWWKFDRKNDFLRGYHIEFGGGRGGSSKSIYARYKGYGAFLKSRDCHGIHRFFRARRDDPQRKSFICEHGSRHCRPMGYPGSAFPLAMERQRKSKWRRTCRKPFSHHRDGRWDLSQQCEAGRTPWCTGIADGGVSGSLGTARMGTIQKPPVLKRNPSPHDVKIFVTDAAALCKTKKSDACIMALSWKASEYLLAQHKGREGSQSNEYRAVTF